MGGQRRNVLGELCYRVPQGARDSGPGPFHVAADAAEPSAETDGAGQLGDEVRTVALAEFGPGRVVASAGVVDVVLDLGEASAVCRPRLAEVEDDIDDA